MMGERWGEGEWLYSTSEGSSCFTWWSKARFWSHSSLAEPFSVAIIWESCVLGAGITGKKHKPSSYKQRRPAFLNTVEHCSLHGWGAYCKSPSVGSDSLRPHGVHSPQNSPGQNTGVDSRSLLQGIFPTQGSNPGLPHCRGILDQVLFIYK